MIRACVIGVSGFGAVHYEDIVREVGAKRMQIVGAAVINQDEEKEKCAMLRSLGCELFDTHKAMLAACKGKADLCMIPTGIPLHAPMTIDAVRTGLHVFVEKPAAGSIQEVRRMQEAAREANRLVAVGFQDMYGPVVEAAKCAIMAGEIGTVRVIKGATLWPRTERYYTRNRWVGRFKVGESWVLDSPFNNASAHEVMMMLFMAGRSERSAGKPVEVEAELYHANPIEGPDTACIRVTTDTGIPILICMTHACEKEGGAEIEILGSAGMIRLSRDRVSVEPSGGTPRVVKGSSKDDLRARMMKQIVGASRGRGDFVCDLELASRQTLVANGAHAAAAVHAVPADGIRVKTEDDSRLTFIPGIDDLIRRAMTEEKLFSELGVPWARPAGRFSLGGFRNFNGGKTGQ